MVEFTVAALAAAGGAESDPFVGVVAKALSVPLHHCYALLWRSGLIELGDCRTLQTR
ncbi:MAG: hypothetical protein JO280_14105 [Mycobacteriaceae bacterium]|nr:hypothetical protein [Mycobacteriaceae bacterium]